MEVINSQKIRKFIHGFSIGDKTEGFISDFQKSKLDLPGPGNYEIEKSISYSQSQKAIKGQKKGLKCTFGSQTRFKKIEVCNTENTDFKYNIEQSWIKGKNKTIGLSKRISDSNLKFASGSGILGPGQYNISTNSFQKPIGLTKTSTFGQQPRLNDSLGAPAQSLIHSYFPPIIDKKQSAIISSAQKESFIVYDKQIPGVGRYNIEKNIVQGDQSFRNEYLKSNSNRLKVSHRFSPKRDSDKKNQKTQSIEKSLNNSLTDFNNSSPKNKLATSNKNLNQGVTFPKFKRWKYKSVDYEPSPNDFVYNLNNFQKGPKFSQGKRPQIEKLNTNPGVGEYTVEQDTIQNDLNKLKMQVKTQQSLNTSQSFQNNYQTTPNKSMIDIKIKEAKIKKLQNLKITDDQSQIEHLINQGIPLNTIISNHLPAPGQYESISSLSKEGAIFQKTNRKHEYLDIFNEPQKFQRSPGPIYAKETQLNRGVTMPKLSRPENVFTISEAPSIGTYNVDQSSFRQVKKKSKNLGYRKYY